MENTGSASDALPDFHAWEIQGGFAKILQKKEMQRLETILQFYKNGCMIRYMSKDGDSPFRLAGRGTGGFCCASGL